MMVAAGMVTRGRDGGGKKKCKMVEVQGQAVSCAESGSVWYVGVGDKSKGWQRECHAARHDGKEGNASIGMGHQVAVAVVSSSGGKEKRGPRREARGDNGDAARGRVVTAGTSEKEEDWEEKEEDREEKEEEKEKET